MHVAPKLVYIVWQKEHRKFSEMEPRAESNQSKKNFTLATWDYPLVISAAIGATFRRR